MVGDACIDIVHDIAPVAAGSGALNLNEHDNDWSLDDIVLSRIADLYVTIRVEFMAVQTLGHELNFSASYKASDVFGFL